MNFLFHCFLLASFLVFAIGCGKDNKSGSNLNYASLYNNGLTPQSRIVLDKLTTWHQNSNEGVAITGLRNVIKKEILYGQNGSPTEEKQLSSQIMNLVQDGRKISDKGYTELNEVFNSSQGTLVSAVDVSTTRSELTFLRTDGIIISYLIDRSYHSMINPIKKSEITQTNRRDIIKTVY